MLEIEQLQFNYADDLSPMEFNLAVNPGEVISMIGPSGAGKTTLFNLIAGFLRPASGEIKIDGLSILSASVSARPVSLVFQQFNLFPHLDAFSNVALGLKPDLRLSAEQRLRVVDVMASLGLAGFEHRVPGQLSGGQQQRVALARAMVRNRRVLLLDEAFTALGPSMRSDLLKLVRQLVADHQMMAISISHQPSDAMLISDRLVFVDQGRVIKQGATREMLEDSGHQQIADYLGTYS